MATVTGRLLTAAEFARLPEPADGSKQELVRGEIETMPPPGFRHGRCQLRVGRLMDQHADSHRLGQVTVESGLVIEHDPDTVRGPDVAFWSAERLPLDQVPAGYPDVAADLCVEVVSPHDLHHRLQAKVLEYLDRGVRLVWVVDPEARTVTVYRSRDAVRILDENATLSGEEVLPGFQCRVAELFA